jgi:hypothetical protein
MKYLSALAQFTDEVDLDTLDPVEESDRDKRNQRHQVLEYMRQKGWINYESMLGGGGYVSIRAEGIDTLNAPPSQATTQSVTYNVHGVHGPAQFGNNNVQNITYRQTLERLCDEIEKSDMDEGEKTEAKSYVQAVLHNPLLNTVLGSALSFGGAVLQKLVQG